jgi:uncharacterized membrane protein
MMQLAHPEALILIPLWLLGAWMMPALGLLKPLRLTVGILLLLVWLNPSFYRQQKGLDLWVLFDQSLSARDMIQARQAELENLIEQGRGKDDGLFYVDYAGEIGPRESRQTILYPDQWHATRTASALQFALSSAESKRPSRILLVTDGYSTEPLDEAGQRLLDQGIPLDIRLLTSDHAADVRVEELIVPERVLPGEPFIIEARLGGRPDGIVPCVLYRNDTVLARADVTLRLGRGRVRWTDALNESGAVQYRLELHPDQDAFPGNNQQQAWVEMRGGPRVLLVTAYADDPLAPLLRAQGFDVETITDARAATVGRLTGARALILNNVPAYALPSSFLEAIPFYVREQGGGLLITGGRNSYAAGGYFESPVDPLLPVSMELKQEHRKLAVAMAIVMDRSGSMSAGVVGGGATKMDLANAGAARAIELLGDRDAVTVFAVDSTAHRIIPLTTLGKNRQRVMNLVRRIQSAGGGIFVYNGLKAAWDELKPAQQGQRHIILFSDAADTEQPDQYVDLIGEMLDAGATISVIALGRESDSDAPLLIDIAARGHGRIMFNDDASTLPSIFAQETVALSRAAFIEEPTAVLGAPGWVELAARAPSWLNAVDGYNLNYLREDAAVSAVTGDEYAAPLVAHWLRGAGRVAAIAFPLGGPHSERIRQWDGYGDLVRTMTRWLMGQDIPQGMGIRAKRNGEWLDVDLLYDESWYEKLALTPPRLVTVAGTSTETVQHVWRRVEPGRFAARLLMPPGSWVRGAVQWGETTFPFGPVASASDPEWRFNPARVEELRRIADASGGEERLDLSGIWTSPPERKTYRDIRDALMIVLIVCFLADALRTRLGGQRITWARAEKTASRLMKPAARRKQEPLAPAINSTDKPQSTSPDPAPRRRIFDQARIKGRP